jgi:hypothetical protein
MTLHQQLITANTEAMQSALLLPLPDQVKALDRIIAIIDNQLRVVRGETVPPVSGQS